MLTLIVGTYRLLLLVHFKYEKFVVFVSYGMGRLFKVSRL